MKTIGGGSRVKPSALEDQDNFPHNIPKYDVREIMLSILIQDAKGLFSDKQISSPQELLVNFRDVVMVSEKLQEVAAKVFDYYHDEEE